MSTNHQIGASSHLIIAQSLKFCNFGIEHFICFDCWDVDSNQFYHKWFIWNVFFLIFRNFFLIISTCVSPAFQADNGSQFQHKLKQLYLKCCLECFLSISLVELIGIAIVHAECYLFCLKNWVIGNKRVVAEDDTQLRLTKV